MSELFNKLDDIGKEKEQKQRKELLLFNYGIEGLAKLDQSNKEAFD